MRKKNQFPLLLNSILSIFVVVVVEIKDERKKKESKIKGEKVRFNEWRLLLLLLPFIIVFFLLFRHGIAR